MKTKKRNMRTEQVNTVVNLEIEKKKTIDSLATELKELEKYICLPNTKAAEQRDARVKKVKRMLKNVDKLYTK